MFYKLLFMATLMLNSYLNANLLKDVDTFSATFKQNITNSANTTISYEGEIFIKEKNKILWKYEKPIKKYVYIVQNSVIIDEPELEQAIYTTINDENDISTIFQNAKQISENQYKATIQGTNYLIFDKKNSIEIHYKDELENKIVIYFEHIQKNIDLNDNIFKFLIPKNYDIIRK